MTRFTRTGVVLVVAACFVAEASVRAADATGAALSLADTRIKAAAVLEELQKNNVLDNSFLKQTDPNVLLVVAGELLSDKWTPFERSTCVDWIGVECLRLTEDAELRKQAVKRLVQVAAEDKDASVAMRAVDKLQEARSAEFDAQGQLKVEPWLKAKDPPRE